MDQTKSKLTPPEIARRWGIGTSKVLGWIRAGELRAIDAAASPGQRPRYLVDITDLAAFENRRAVTGPTRSSRRRKLPNSVTEYF